MNFQTNGEGGTTTAEKISGTKIWVPTPGAQERPRERPKARDRPLPL